MKNQKTYRDFIQKIFENTAFTDFYNINILPLIYNEKNKKCNILVFDYEKAQNNTSQILLEKSGRGRKHPVFRFYDADKNYICEVRYGGTDANALQKGIKTLIVDADPQCNLTAYVLKLQQKQENEVRH